MSIGLALEELKQRSPSSRYLIAFSGGVDSHVLLHALKNQCNNSLTSLRAIHVNHQVHPDSEQWVEHCQQVCDVLDIPLIIETISVDASNEGFEAAARRMRYELFATHLNDDEILLTAHHQDDQLETFFLQLMRGAGPRGLSAMPMQKNFASGWHDRPLLQISRQEIQDYASLHQLHWIEDSSNYSTQYDRNFLRQDVLPLLKKRWPSMHKTISRSAQLCADAARLQQTIAEQDYTVALGSAPETLSISGLFSLETERRFNVLRKWLEKQSGFIPSLQQLKQIQHDVLRCRVDAQPQFLFAKGVVSRYRDDLYWVQTVCVDPLFEILWDCRAPLSICDGLHHFNPEDYGGFDELLIRFRREGDGRSLKKLFQQWGVPPWQRSTAALVFHQTVLVAVQAGRKLFLRKSAACCWFHCL